MTRAVPSIRARLANAVAGWAVVWGLAIGAAVWFAPGVPEGSRDPLVVALCVGGAISISRQWERRA